MKRNKKILSIVLSMSMAFSVSMVQPGTKVMADEGIISSFNYDFAYETAGYADGTIYIKSREDGVYKIFWGDSEGNKLKKDEVEYSYLARVVVKDGTGSFNIINDYTAIPEGAGTVLVYRKDNKVYTYNIPENKQFKAGENSYTFGSISDPHFTRYSSVYDDDAIPAMDNAMNFLDKAGIKFVAMSGDLTNAGEQKALDRFNDALSKHPDMTVVTAIGNHDSRTTLSTSNKTILDTSISRWYNSITSSYYTVEDGQVKVNDNFKNKGFDILATDALTNPIDTEYREEKNGDAISTTVPGLDFVTEAGGNIFIFFNDIAKTGETYDTDKLVTTGQMDWLEEQLEKYKDRNVFLYQHYYLAVNTLNNDAVDMNNSTGDLKNDGGYSYDLDYKDVVTTTSGKNLQTLLSEYGNTTLVSGHSHWQYSMQSINANLNFGRLAGGDGATMIHLSSVTEPRYIGKDDSSRTSLNGYASEGATVTTYDDCTVYNNIDFTNNQYEAYATYIVPTGKDSKYQPIKNQEYKESSDEITGDEYLELEDLTEVQLVKSDFNLLKGAAYTYSSKGVENKDTALTDGSSTGGYWNSKEGSKSDQRITVETDGIQKTDNLNYFMLYFVNEVTSAKKFNIQLSLDGETFETIYESPDNYSYKNRRLSINTDNIKLQQYKYVRLNLTDGAKTYGYQIREFVAVGYNRNETPNKAESRCGLDKDAPIDESDYINTEYNLIYNAPYEQSSTGSENKEGALTDGKLNGFANTERSKAAKDQTFVIDIGESNEQKISKIDYLLLYNQNNLTNATAFDVSVSLDGKYYETIGEYSNIELEQEHFDVDLSGVTIDKFRYIKLHLKDGNISGGYGYQIKEFAVIKAHGDMEDASVDVSADSFTYNGSPIKPEVTVDLKGRKLSSDDFAVSYSKNVNVGEGEITVTGKGDYTGVKTVKFKIDPLDISSEIVKSDTLNVKAIYEFVGKDITPIIKLTHNGKKLNPMGDYTVEYSNNFYPGNAKIVVKGIGNYTGQIEKQFTISKKEIKNVTIRTDFDSNKLLVVTVNNGSYDMKKGVDYNYNVVTDSKGNITITFTGLGKNYKGTYIKTISAKDNPNAPVEVKVANVKLKFIKNVKGKKISLKWNKVSKVSGYNIRYATSKKKLNKAKNIVIKKNTTKYTIKKLKKKKYYVQIRAYKTVNGEKHYGKWSKTTNVKVSK